jgi:hypothetical protein
MQRTNFGAGPKPTPKAVECAITAKKKLNILDRDPDECEFTPVDTSFIDIICLPATK